MHPYDPPRAPYYPSTISPLRPARDRESAPAASHTPIFDTLYSEYLRAFRALPGDRSGEENLGFTAFSHGGGSGSGASGGWNGSAWPVQQTDSWQPAYSYAGQSTPQYAASGSVISTSAAAYGNGRQYQTGTYHIPAALPPAPRRGY
ncbi:hypothetical protein MTF65_20805 [Streptomyces sp. APSN-46.1]|uniref:hypothetical protein n=1 Tax=Streptomyces sp. APSN-46.1 TaxID=2929049 RepID=UPI001FB20059|nr:hypothetical protein [Streptomyces sp. APSN-46.1]MCJ1679738.1 hypothetical protein [Streptomyces sp. APSN-46.1]